MVQEKKLKNYCEKMLLDLNILYGRIEIEDNIYHIVESKEKIFDEELTITLEKVKDTDGWVFEFGGRWYYQKHDEKLTLTELVNIGKAKQRIPTKTFLGIRSGYELMNGVGLYKDWIKKAKFLGITSLAICEKNSLSGALAFQKACKSAGIKSIFGMTLQIKTNEDISEVKLYVKDFQGWLNLLKFNSEINVYKKNYIELDFLLKNREGLFIVADPKAMRFKNSFSEIDFYQLDTVIFTNSDEDKEYLENLKTFIQSKFQPISITDAFYIEESESRAREALWDINKAYDSKSCNQFFKNKDFYAKELINLFENGNNSWVKLFKKAVESEDFLVSECNYTYDTSTRHLPRYIMSKEESENFKTNEELFLHLIKKGFKEKLSKEDSKIYVDRLKTEIEVLKNGDVIDYFLAIYDISKFAKNNNMMTGIGRGSAGGSLVAYLLDIIKIDPLKFGLLFERFLNAGRMGKWVECEAYEIELENGEKVTLIEGELVRIKRNGKETAVLVHDLEERDEIIRF